MALEKIDVAALRRADSIVFRHGERCVIEAIKENPRSERDPFATEQRHVIAVESVVCDHGTDGGAARGHTGFYLISSAQYSREWSTIVNLLKGGDDVGLLWVAANDNDYLRGARLHIDNLYLTVARNGKHFLSLFVGYSVCPDNSARMVRAIS